MNRLLWFLLNCVLVATAYGVTVWVLNQVPAAPAESDPSASDPSAAERGEDRRAGKRSPDVGSRLPGARPEELAVLWRETLFRPDRSEELEPEATEEETVQDQPFNLELIGLAQIGERSIAVIVEHRASVRRPRVTARSAVSRNRPPPAPGIVEESGSPDRHVYEVDDEIGDSGYTVKEIRLDDEEVVIERGNEERVLNLDKSDDQSSSRLKTAADAAEARQERVAAKSAAEGSAGTGDAATPPAPPPPPVAVGGKGPDGKAGASGTAPTSTKPVTQMTREERLERARLLRERILQRRAQSKTD